MCLVPPQDGLGPRQVYIVARWPQQKEDDGGGGRQELHPHLVVAQGSSSSKCVVYMFHLDDCRRPSGVPSVGDIKSMFSEPLQESSAEGRK